MSASTGGPRPRYDVSAARGAPPRRTSPTMGTLVRLEVARTMRLKRPWLGLLLAAAVPVILALSLRLSDSRPEGPDEGPPFLFDALRNGLFIPFVSIEVMVSSLLPAIVALVAADALAGETASGTIRALLARPVTRTRVLVSKWVLSALYAALAVVVIAASGLVAGVAVFGARDVNTVLYGIVTVERSLGALVLTVLFAAVCMLGVVGIALVVSTSTASPIGAFFGTLAVVVVQNILRALPSFDPIQPALLVAHFRTWTRLIREPPDYEAFSRGLVVPLLYAAVGVLLAWLRFRRRDITA